MKNYLRLLTPMMLLLAVLFGGGKSLAADVTTSQTSFSATSADNIGGDKNVSYSTAKGNASTAPFITNSNELRLYQGTSTKYGGTITITAKNSVTIKSVEIGSSQKTKIAYSTAESTAQSSVSDLAANGKYEASNLSTTSVTFYCWGTSSSARLNVNYLSVTYETAASAAATVITFPHSSYEFVLGQDEGTAIIDDNTAVLKDAAGNDITGTVTYKVLSQTVDGLAMLGGEETESSIMVDTNKEGSATIQASYAGETDKYKATSATYTITVAKEKTATTLSFGEAYDGKTISAELSEGFTAPTATLTPSVEGATIKYTSSKTSVATVDETTGVVTLKGVGTTVITATYDGDDDYIGSTVSYTLTVTKTVDVEDGVFDFSGDEDYGSGVTKTSDGNSFVTEDKTWIADNVTMVTSGKYRWWQKTSGLRFYDGGNFTLSVPNGYVITKVKLAGTYSFDVQSGTFASGVWTGASSSVKFTSNTNGKDLDKVTVTYVKLETLTTSASGYATYFADYATDYSEAGLTAYTVKVNGNKVVATEYKGVVPAGKAVLVKGDASKDYTLAPATEAADEFDTDLLASDGKATSDGSTYFAFSSNGTKGFKLVADGVAIPAKKGYLVVADAAGANFLSFDDETTGINAVEAAAAADGKAYNMAGQRVSKAYKGLVIVGGKKYLNK